MSENSNSDKWAGADLKWNEDKQAELSILVPRIDESTTIAIEEIENAGIEEICVVIEGELTATASISIPLYRVIINSPVPSTITTDRYLKGIFIVNISDPCNGYQYVELTDNALQDSTLKKGKRVRIGIQTQG
jgi:hypothetical protein